MLQNSSIYPSCIGKRSMDCKLGRLAHDPHIHFRGIKWVAKKVDRNASWPNNKSHIKSTTLRAFSKWLIMQRSEIATRRKTFSSKANKRFTGTLSGFLFRNKLVSKTLAQFLSSRYYPIKLNWETKIATLLRNGNWLLSRVTTSCAGVNSKCGQQK